MIKLALCKSFNPICTPGYILLILLKLHIIPKIKERSFRLSLLFYCRFYSPNFSAAAFSIFRMGRP